MRENICIYSYGNVYSIENMLCTSPCLCKAHLYLTMSLHIHNEWRQFANFDVPNIRSRTLNTTNTVSTLSQSFTERGEKSYSSERVLLPVLSVLSIESQYKSNYFVFSFCLIDLLFSSHSFFFIELFSKKQYRFFCSAFLRVIINKLINTPFCSPVEFLGSLFYRL